jgi:hypothetical protein
MNSDKKTLKQLFLNGKRFAATVAMLMLASLIVTAQDLIVMEGSVHSFSVVNNPQNTFVWSYHDLAFNPMPVNSIEYIDGQFDTDVTVRFSDYTTMVQSEMVLLAVTETNPHGCSTIRALKIQIEPNNMFLEFASAETQDCFNMGEFYAPLKVGLNFKNKAANVPIAEGRFPLQVNYEIRNITDNGPNITGNSGAPLTLEYNEANDYYLLVTEAVGELTRTIEYELTITQVTDRYQAVINNNEGDIRLQIRIINRLPQSGGMEMAMAYHVTPIRYNGEL